SRPDRRGSNGGGPWGAAVPAAASGHRGGGAPQSKRSAIAPNYPFLIYALRPIQEPENRVLVLGNHLERGGVDEIAIALRGEAEACRDRGDAVIHVLVSLQWHRLAPAGRRNVAQVARPFGIGVAEQDDPDGLRVREHALELECPEEESLVGERALLHDAGNAGEVEVQERKRQGALEQTRLVDREWKGAIQGDDEGTLRPFGLELL